jgi:hypothetical protein
MVRKPFIFIMAMLVVCFFGSAALAMTVSEFYNLALGQSNINPFAVTVQSAHETAYWTSFLWKNANNGAGLKAPSEWIESGNPYVVVESPESRNGSYYKNMSKFRQYGSPAQFIADYAAKIRADYPRCVLNRDNIWGYFAGLYEGRIGKWATDHKYYEKLTIKAVKLAPEIFGSIWYEKLVNDYFAAISRNSLKSWQKEIIEKELMRTAGAM